MYSQTIVICLLHKKKLPLCQLFDHLDCATISQRGFSSTTVKSNYLHSQFAIPFYTIKQIVRLCKSAKLN